jgi:hypothetical protein
MLMDSSEGWLEWDKDKRRYSPRLAHKIFDRRQTPFFTSVESLVPGKIGVKNARGASCLNFLSGQP